jgi:regulator of protease activity HflC (stomatin/prohibitin superfamily)
MFFDFAFTNFSAILLIGAIVFIALGVKTVPQGYEWTVERFGRYMRTLQPGLHVIVPLIDRIGHKVTRMEQVTPITRQEVITKDNASVQVDGVAFIQVLDVARAAYEVQNLAAAIQNLAMTNIRSVIGSMNLDELLSEREQINQRLLAVIDKATQEWGVKVTRVEIKDIQPPAELVEAMSKQMIAEREKRATITESEGQRQAAINNAEGEKQSAILTAEGRLAAAQKDAEARERLAEAEAKATKVVSEAVKAGDPQALSYFIGQKYIEALSVIGSAENQKIIFMPLEASGVIGALGGMNELLRNLNETKTVAPTAKPRA